METFSKLNSCRGGSVRPHFCFLLSTNAQWRTRAYAAVEGSHSAGYGLGPPADPRSSGRSLVQLMYPSSVRGVAPVRLIACSQIEMDIVPGCEGPSIAALCGVRVV